VEGSDLYLDPAPGPGSPPPLYSRQAEGIWGMGDTITWISGLVLMLSPFMNWYSGSGLGVSLSVTGWHTGVLGKLVFFLGLAVVVLVLGAVATVFVLIRMINVPDAVLPADSRGIGLWIALVAALGVIAGGLLRAAEDF